jgi:hypothetical protein
MRTEKPTIAKMERAIAPMPQLKTKVEKEIRHPEPVEGSVPSLSTASTLDRPLVLSSRAPHPTVSGSNTGSA